MNFPSRVLVFVLAAFNLVRSAEPEFVPLASGALGDIHAKDGDRAFNAEYFRTSDFASEPIMARLENEIGRQPVPAGTSAARWSATVMPLISGEFALALRSTATATLKLDGEALLRHDAISTHFAERTTTKLAMMKGKPYELVVEFESPTGPRA